MVESHSLHSTQIYQWNHACEWHRGSAADARYNPPAVQDGRHANELRAAPYATCTAAIGWTLCARWSRSRRFVTSSLGWPMPPDSQCSSCARTVHGSVRVLGGGGATRIRDLRRRSAASRTRDDAFTRARRRARMYARPKIYIRDRVSLHVLIHKFGGLGE